MLDHLLATLWRALAAVALGCAAGVPIGAALGLMPRGRIVEAVLSAPMTVPGMALAPLALMAFGFGDVPIVAVGAVAAFFPAAFQAAAGVRSVEPEIVEAARVDGASEVVALVSVRLPASAAIVVEGLGLALTKGWRTVVAIEFVAAASRGLGYAVKDAAEYIRLDRVFVFAAVILGVHWTLRKGFGLAAKALGG